MTRTPNALQSRLRKAGLPVLLLVVALTILLLAGCGPQTAEANKQQEKVNQDQQEAQALFAKLKSLPTDWRSIFSTSTATASQVSQGRQLIKARLDDIKSLDPILTRWEHDTNAILGLNIDNKIKDYVTMEAAAIKLWRQYFDSEVKRVVTAYNGLLDAIAGGDLSLRAKAADHITTVVSQSSASLRECTAAQQKAEQYLKTHNIGQ